MEFKRITDQNRKLVMELQLLPGQIHFIESVTECLDEAAQISSWNPYAIYENNNLVGFTMYGNIKEDKWGERVWLDRLLIDKSYQGRGYGKKAVKLLSRKLFEEYPVDQIYLSVYSDNINAIHLYEKCGFHFNGETDSKGEKIMILKKDSL